MVLTLLEEGRVDAADAVIHEGVGHSAGAGDSGSWPLPLWQGMRALLQGRFAECERRVQEASLAARHLGPQEQWAATALLVALRREQGRLVEAEGVFRGGPGGPKPIDRARRAWLLCDLGRDAEARSQLRGLTAGALDPSLDGDGLATMVLWAESALVLEQAWVAGGLHEGLTPFTGRLAVEASGAVCYGAVDRALAAASQLLGRWDEADGHYRRALEVNLRAGAPIQAAHTRRQHAALLRSRGDLGDWDEAIDLLGQAEAAYRRLGIDRLAGEAQAVLARAHEGPSAHGRKAIRREGDTWAITYEGTTVRVTHDRGVGVIAFLLMHPGIECHVTDLFFGFARTPGGAGSRPRSEMAREEEVPLVGVGLDRKTEAEYSDRIAALRSEVARAEGAGEVEQAALAKAEMEMIAAELGGEAATELAAATAPDPVERARLAVGFGVRVALDRIERAHRELGRHLRHSIRTGTFCSYEPGRPTTWTS